MERIFGRNLYTEGCHNYPKFDFLWKECEIIGDVGISYKTFEKCAIVEWMDRFDYFQIISFTPNNDNKNLS